MITSPEAFLLFNSVISAVMVVVSLPNETYTIGIPSHNYFFHLS